MFICNILSINPLQHNIPADPALQAPLPVLFCRAFVRRKSLRDETFPPGVRGTQHPFCFLSQMDKMAMSAGVMPEIRPACPKSTGRMADSFSRDS